jgi:8-oxo-dGTP pyrophosphatase MutT (NUDIX family)
LRFEHAVARLERALKEPLPGNAAHELMAPRPRRSWPEGFDPLGVRHAAGLLVMFPRDEHPHVILTVRAHTLDRHGGQVSLPGGVVDRGETHEQAARREAREEIGLAPDDVRTLGALTPIDIPVSGFRLHPIVAVLSAPPQLSAAENEVAHILEVPLDALMTRPIQWRSAARDGRSFDFPAFVVDGTEIWGATAMVLAELLAILGWKGPPGDLPLRGSPG